MGLRTSWPQRLSPGTGTPVSQTSGLWAASCEWGPGGLAGEVGQGCTGGAKYEQEGVCKEVRTCISKYRGGAVVVQAHEDMYVTCEQTCADTGPMGGAPTSHHLSLQV